MNKGNRQCLRNPQTDVARSGAVLLKQCDDGWGSHVASFVAGPMNKGFLTVKQPPRAPAMASASMSFMAEMKRLHG
jgi:hypothetical protein